jgi:hypothetical protein
MQTKFTTSVNIIRDAQRDINYIPTPNAKQVASQLGSDFKRGIRSFNIIGSYGTGKSAFLWSLRQTLLQKKHYFDLNLVKDPKVDFINLIGEYRSVATVFSEFFEIKAKLESTEHTLSEIYNRYHDIGSKNRLLVILVDEFGKFLEYAAQHSPEKELYFIQQLAEFVNNPDHNIILITTVHQNMDAYAQGLTSSQKQEWTKVKGRFKEITFNEPVEQLLFLAAEHIEKANSAQFEKGIPKKALEIFQETQIITGNLKYVNAIANKLYPLDLLAAVSVTVSLQKHGQNERSLFTFLETTDHTGLNSLQWKRTNPLYNLACVYDYLIFNFYSSIYSRYNPEYSGWVVIKNTLEYIERHLPDETGAFDKLVKTIGILNLTVPRGSVLNKTFLINYAETCLGIPNSKGVIENLEENKVIYFRNHKNAFVLSEGSDLDISSALTAAGSKMNEISDVPTLLNKYYNLPLVFVKRHSLKTGTPRFFEYIASDSPIHVIPKGEIDGYINLVFSDHLTVAEVKRASTAQEEAIIYCYYKKTNAIKKLLFELETTKRVIQEQEVANDRFALKELRLIMEHQQNLLNHKVINSFYAKEDVTWMYGGREVSIRSKKDLNKQLSIICELVYNESPAFNNELANKHKISSSIFTARRNYLKALVTNWNQPQLGFNKDKYPPEKTIYLSLLESNGIQLFSDSMGEEVKPNENQNFQHLWGRSNAFLDGAKKNRKSIMEFVELLGTRPLKLKQGFIDFWIPTFLFIKRDDFSLFGPDGYIPNISSDVLDLIIRDPADFEIKTFDIEGVKLDLFNSYRILLEQDTEVHITGVSFIETIKPFITFYKNLNQYAKLTNRLSPEAVSIRQAIITAKDPEQTFFKAFPNALGFAEEELQNEDFNLKAYVSRLKEAIRELRTCYDQLVIRFETFIQKEVVGSAVPFEQYKELLQVRFTKLKKHLLLPYQQTFIQRLDSQLEDRAAWLTMVSHAVTGNMLEKLVTKEAEHALYDKFKALIIELDSLTELSASDFSEDKEDVIGLEITSFIEGVDRKLIRWPKSKKQEVERIEEQVRKTLSKDRTMNIAALAGILKEILKNE